MKRHTKAVMTALHCDIGEYDDHTGGGECCFEHETDINETGECIFAEHIATELANAGLLARPLPTRDEIFEAIDDAIYLDLNDVTRAEMDTATEQAADAVLQLLAGRDNT